MLSALTRLAGPSKHWLLMIQDYLFYGLLFVSGPVGIFSTLWSAQTLTCVPMLDCYYSPQDSELCAGRNDTGMVWQELAPTLSRHLNDLCVHKLPIHPYILIAYAPLFGVAVVLWLLHMAWLWIPPYNRIAKLYGQLESEQRKQILEEVQKWTATGAAEIGTARKAIADLRKKKCWPGLGTFFFVFEWINIALCLLGGILVYTKVLGKLSKAFDCTIGKELLPPKYTSISCSLYDEIRYQILYYFCAIDAFVIMGVKVVTWIYIWFKSPCCCKKDEELLNILLEKSDKTPRISVITVEAPSSADKPTDAPAGQPEDLQSSRPSFAVEIEPGSIGLEERHTV